MQGKGELGRELLRQDAADAPPTDSDPIARDERRRVRRWATASVVLWVLAAGYLIALIAMYLVFIHPAITDIARETEADPARLGDILRALLLGMRALMAWPALLLLAGGCTTVFILTSRRATLSRIQTGLTSITAQLEALSGPGEQPNSD